VDGTDRPGEPAIGEDPESNPLVQRVDALLRRHQEQTAAQRAAVAEGPPDPVPAAPPAALVEDDFPVLTEIVDPALAAHSLPVLAPAAAPAPQPEAADPEQVAALLEATVLDKLLPEIERTLDQRLARNISDLLEQVLHGLRAELSVSVRQMVREAVSAAVARELAARSVRADEAPGGDRD
jgi:hypothetical protein